LTLCSNCASILFALALLCVDGFKPASAGWLESIG
jgi:hypothetical protein